MITEGHRRLDEDLFAGLHCSNAFWNEMSAGKMNCKNEDWKIG
jgi:hypothetical protein